MARARKPKKIKVSLIAREDPTVKGSPYKILDRLVGAHHAHLSEARIALAWHVGWNGDADGHLKVGRAKKASDLDRELHGYDFVILLNRFVWNLVEWTDVEMSALLDHELCHCSVRLDKEGEAQRDEHNRTVWRIRKHDVEEFQEIMHRHGAWKGDLKTFIKEALRRRQSPLLDRTDVDVPTAACPPVSPRNALAASSQWHPRYGHAQHIPSGGSS